MKCNTGRTDRVVRTIAGLFILGLGVAYGSWWGLVGLLPLATALVGWCPAYAAAGISTCRGGGEVLPDTSATRPDQPLRVREGAVRDEQS